MPRIWIIRSSVCKVNGGVADTFLYCLNRYIYIQILINSVRLKSRLFNCRSKQIVETLIEFVAVKWLNNETGWHWTVLTF